MRLVANRWREVGYWGSSRAGEFPNHRSRPCAYLSVRCHGYRLGRQGANGRVNQLGSWSCSPLSRVRGKCRQFFAKRTQRGCDCSRLGQLNTCGNINVLFSVGFPPVPQPRRCHCFLWFRCCSIHCCQAITSSPKSCLVICFSRRMIACFTCSLSCLGISETK